MLLDFAPNITHATTANAHIVLIADTSKSLYHIHSQLPYYPNVTELWLGDDLPKEADSLLFISQSLTRASVYVSQQPLWVFMDITMYPALASQIVREGREHDVFLIGYAPSRHDLSPIIRDNVKIMTATRSMAY